MKNWFLVSTKPKKEFIIESIITNSLSDVEVYLPKYKKRDGTIAPFFPNYIFIKFDPEKYFHIIKYTQGVRKIVSNDEGPVPVPEWIINDLKSREEKGIIKLGKKTKKLKPGDRVIIEEGPLRGWVGIFEKEVNDSGRVIVLLSYMKVNIRKEILSLY